MSIFLHAVFLMRNDNILKTKARRPNPISLVLVTICQLLLKHHWQIWDIINNNTLGLSGVNHSTYDETKSSKSNRWEHTKCLKNGNLAWMMK